MEISLDIDTSGLLPSMKKYVESIKDNLNKACNDAIRQSVQDVFPKIEQRGQEMFMHTIHEFYGSYNPIYYARTGSMYDLLHIEFSDKTVNWGYDPEKMQTSNGSLSADGLYDFAFIKGWHGGAPGGPNHPSSGVPYWRRPYGSYKVWGSPAAVSASPYEAFEQEFNEYLDNEATEEIQSIFNAYLSRIL